jgi:anti-sigma B factor antagonist
MAELNISERQVGGVTILDMDGKITIGEGSVALRTAIRRLRYVACSKKARKRFF